MPDIRYVCLSDMHLGAQNSLLTNLTPNNKSSDTSVASPVLTALVECLKELIARNENNEKPTLILAGDILELALTTDNLAAMAFERFVDWITVTRLQGGIKVGEESELSAILSPRIQGGFQCGHTQGQGAGLVGAQNGQDRKSVV